MLSEIKKYAKIMYEKDFLYGLNGSLSMKVSNDILYINKNIIYNESDDYFAKLELNENYKYEDANKDINKHIAIYNNFYNAKVIARIVSKDILKVCKNSIFQFNNELIVIQNENILQNESDLIAKLSERNFLLIKNFGLLIFSRDFDSLFSKIFDIDLSAKIV